MAKSLKDYFDTEVILEYIRNYEEPETPGNKLFPNKRVESIKAKWKKSMNSLPVMANFVGMNAESNIIGRDGLQEVEGELGFMKVKTFLDEEDIIEKYYTPRQGTRDQEMAIEDVYNDVRKVIDAIRARSEYTKIRAVADGKIDIVVRRGSNEQTINLDYGFPSEHKAQPATLFDDASAKPLHFIYDMNNTIVDDAGIDLEQILTTQQVVNYIAETTQIKQELYDDGTTTRLIGLEDINNLLVRKDLPPLYVMKGKARTEEADGSKITVPYFPAKKFVGIPGGELGEGLYGPTAEERKQDVEMTEVDYILSYLIEEDEPPAEFVKAVASFLPTLPVADAIYTTEVLT